MLATGETGVAIRQNPLALAMGRMSNLKRQLANAYAVCNNCTMQYILLRYIFLFVKSKFAYYLKHDRYTYA